MEKYHDALWTAINRIADKNGLSCSGLAVLCGLDATTFNISKRKSSCGQPRWISGDTLAKILVATNLTPVQFAKIFQACLDELEK
jgi:phage repressor protein C with HTH and peptisase S24 domain